MATPRASTSLLIRLDARNRGGLQRQICASIQRAILDGVVGPGTRLPSSRALADDLGVSRTTTLLAVQQLQAEGYLTGRRGSGTFVAAELPGRSDQPAGHPAHPAQASDAVSSRGGAGGGALRAPTASTDPRAPSASGRPVWICFRSRSGRGSRAAGCGRSPRPSSTTASRPACARCVKRSPHHVQPARGTRCDADQILIVAGAQQGLELISRVLLDPGDRVWMEEPGYPGARSALLGAGARIVPVPVDAEGLDVEMGARRAGDARLVYVTPSHQYPLGVPMSLPRRLALLRWASRARAWVIEDDYDSEFRYGARPIPCLHGLDVDGRVIYVGSFSKTLFPSLRLGFLIVPPDLQEGLVAARAAADQHPPVLDQSILADFLVEGHFARHLRRMRVAYRERLEALTAAARATAAARCGCGRRAPACTRSPTSTGWTPRASRRGGSAGASRPRPLSVVLRGPHAVRQRVWSSASRRSAPTRPDAAWSGWPRPSRPPAVADRDVGSRRRAGSLRRSRTAPRTPAGPSGYGRGPAQRLDTVSGGRAYLSAGAERMPRAKAAAPSPVRFWRMRPMKRRTPKIVLIDEGLASARLVDFGLLQPTSW